MVLGDGAGAVVMGAVAEGGIEAIHTHADGRYGDLLYSDPVLECQSDGNRTFTHRELGVRPYLHMDGPRVFPVAVKTMVNDILAVMAKYNRTHQPTIGLDQVGYLFPHQANIRIIEAVVKKLGLPMARVYTDGIARYGNTSTASIPDRLLRDLGHAQRRRRRPLSRSTSPSERASHQARSCGGRWRASPTRRR